MTHNILRFEKNWGELTRWILVILATFSWGVLILYGDQRYETREDFRQDLLNCSDERRVEVKAIYDTISGVNSSSQARDNVIEGKINEDRRDIVQMGKNIERLIAQNEIILGIVQKDTKNGR